MKVVVMQFYSAHNVRSGTV